MKQFAKSLGYAISGVINCLKHERNFKIQLTAMISVTAAGIFFKLSKFEWLITILCMAAVLFAEMINTALEKLCNHITIETHPVIKQVKDIAAGAVLITAITAAIIGLFIFLPKLI